MQLLDCPGLRPGLVEVLPTDKTAQRHLAAADEFRAQQRDRILSRQRGLGLGAPTSLLVNL